MNKCSLTLLSDFVYLSDINMSLSKLDTFNLLINKASCILHRNEILSKIQSSDLNQIVVDFLSDNARFIYSDKLKGTRVEREEFFNTLKRLIK